MTEQDFWDNAFCAALGGMSGNIKCEADFDASTVRALKLANASLRRRREHVQAAFHAEEKRFDHWSAKR